MIETYKRNNVAFDLDGTLIALTEVLFPILSAMVKKDVSKYYKNRKSFDLEIPEIGLTTKVIERGLKISYRLHNYVAVYEGVYDLFFELYERTGDPIRIITARPVWCAGHTHKLVRRIMQDIPYILIFSKKKEIYLKGFKYFVDDRRKMALDLANKGFIVFVPCCNYNEGIDHPNVIYIDKFKELQEKYIHLFI